MALQLSTAVRNAMADQVETTIGVTPTLELRSGLVPTDCAAADVGTVLATVVLPSDWLATAASGAKTLLGTWQDASADATGRPAHFRIKQGATTHMQGRVSITWTINTAYSVNDHVMNGGNMYRCTTAGTSAGAGGPTGTGTGITDNTAVWNFVQAGSDMTIDTLAVTAGQQFTVTSGTLTVGGA